MSQGKTTRRSRILAIAVSLCIVYQMGACPCGCLEHNYWFQALGLSTEHARAQFDDDSLEVIVTASHEHTCSGGTRGLYLDTSISSDSFEFAMASLELPGQRSDLDLLVGQQEAVVHPPPAAFPASHQAAFQVFLI